MRTRESIESQFSQIAKSLAYKCDAFDALIIQVEFESFDVWEHQKMFMIHLDATEPDRGEARAGAGC